MTLDTHALAWAAGFYDGEGCTSVTGRDRTSPRSIRMQVGQIHPEVLERFQAAIGGIGRIYASDRPRSNPYMFVVSSRADVHQAIWLLWPWLGSVKREQAERVIARYHSLEPTLRQRGRAPGRATRIDNTCVNGHVVVGDNTYVDTRGRRRCRLCARDATRRYRAKQAD